MKTLMKLLTLSLIGALIVTPGTVRAAATPSNNFNEGLELYRSGHYSDATEAFERAIKKRDHSQDAADYIERIRKETVERIRNKALTGISKSNWQTKYFFMNSIDNRIRVGISAQEVFERQSVNFRPGAVDALTQLADALVKSDNARIDIDLINETNQDIDINREITTQQVVAVFSYLSLAARGNLPKY